MNSQVMTQTRTAITATVPQPLVATAPTMRVPPLLPALLTGGSLWLCYFPVNCGWLAWVALVPLLTLVRSTARPRTVFLSAWASGLVFFWPAIQWVRVADPRMYISWGFLATYCALYFPLAIWAVRFLERRTRLPLVVTLPVVWTALEFFRSNFGGGFSWYLLGHTQHAFLQLIQIADVTGAYGVSFLVVAVNAVLFELLDGRRWFRRLYAVADSPPRWGRLAILTQGAAVLALLLGTLGYGVWRMEQATFTEGPRIALIQGNLSQQIRNDAAQGESFERHFVSLCDLAWQFQPELIVWPETSYPGEWKDVSADLPPEAVSKYWRERADDAHTFAEKVAERWRTAVLMGMNAEALESDGRTRRYNSAVLITPPGRAVGRYDKMHLVPFGEYVPFREWVPWMKRFAPYDFDYSVTSGREHTRFPLTDAKGERKYTFGVLICYEDTDPAVARPYGGDGQPAADFVLNISNDGWFDGTSEHDQHLAICRFRAIECRRTVARAVNMGISAVIDGNGRVLRPRQQPLPLFPQTNWENELRKQGHRDLPRVWEVPAGAEELPASEWGEYKKVSGILLATVPLDDRTSLYCRWGDWLPWGCWLLFAGAVIVALTRPRRAVVLPG
jgi:apolipoprotein N-acyltransferase